VQQPADQRAQTRPCSPSSTWMGNLRYTNWSYSTSVPATKSGILPSHSPLKRYGRNASAFQPRQGRVIDDFSSRTDSLVLCWWFVSHPQSINTIVYVNAKPFFICNRFMWRCTKDIF
jgi:hypothetical protein